MDDEHAINLATAAVAGMEGALQLSRAVGSLKPLSSTTDIFGPVRTTEKPILDSRRQAQIEGGLLERLGGLSRPAAPVLGVLEQAALEAGRGLVPCDMGRLSELSRGHGPELTT